MVLHSQHATDASSSPVWLHKRDCLLRQRIPSIYAVVVLIKS